MMRAFIIACCLLAFPALAADPDKNDEWNKLTLEFRAAAEKQMPDGSYYTRKCDHKVRHYCFRMMEMVNSEGDDIDAQHQSENAVAQDLANYGDEKRERCSCRHAHGG